MRAFYNTTMGSGKITDLDIQALLDGQLEESAAERLLEALKKDPHLKGRYLQYQKQKQMLKNWWKDN